jgi:NADH:ubiquinone oxidoreductase subunit
MASASFLGPFTKLARQVKQRGWKGTLEQLYTIGDLKFGELRGTDRFGNKYYEDLELPYGQHRWVEYADIHNPDATMIQPEWHGWMHHMYDETPAEVDDQFATTNLQSHEHVHSGGDHVGKIEGSFDTTQDQTAMSFYRQRGYGVGSIKSKAGDPEGYYKQPGHPLSPMADKGGRFKHRKEMGQDAEAK